KAANFISLAKLQIKNGEYDKALETAKQAIKSEPKNAEAYYVLGLAQGYNNLLIESEKSFSKAEELGFKI
ncbi:MAG: tetratricopeptide repeat protein, partial [Cellvibrio sp.]